MKERIIWLDLMKGIAISLVILGHIFNRMGENPITNWIYKFHMPFFFMLSGFLAIKAIKAPLLQGIKKKFITLMVPFITCGFSLSWICDKTDRYIYDTFHGGYWFLLSLFTCWIIFLPLVKLLTHYKCNLISEIIILILPFFLGNFSMHFMTEKYISITSFSFTFAYYRFFIIGYFMGKCFSLPKLKQKLTKFSQYENYLSAFSIITFIGISLCTIANKNFINQIPLTIVQIILCISLFFMIYFLCSHSKLSTSNYLVYLGENSLLLYLFHYLFVYQFPLRCQEIPLGFQCIIALGLTIVVITATILIAYPIKKNSILAFLFLGKNFTYNSLK